LKKYKQQGCGSCPSTTIPCHTCITKECNTEKYFKEGHYCWNTTGTIVACGLKYKKFCYYAVINDKTGIKYIHI